MDSRNHLFGITQGRTNDDNTGPHRTLAVKDLFKSVDIARPNLSIRSRDFTEHVWDYRDACPHVEKGVPVFGLSSRLELYRNLNSINIGDVK
ncbi:hypothetical protein AVEN_198181-1 [Araneus ventricosus]|uniref:Uncharacterized protein n=1 Tax=Araneus ventricosus TaxID=182803 RepID=A0A4Y2RQH3_ARAVE|nr:hypothetical protein AVEN_177851-1 [Araneus ventricosus]GBN71868.1 hypothetical protein AVEN_49307-1 [Araneus ventricosus]GBN77499.1 hypothetical protein AVEN_256487-1 [Araneus ventricosus]GBN77504.1 hypothetical protein AVEN_198181-1 [Araneus ventricosus]